ncbi:multidrug effflux MFS transporter [Palleronia abyssalis]|uniref:Bcr/CflA family efflux transporter n=1 Tax=Palleronia abyssalis TaxID=1501240 RepID=A0A2R8BYT2_9RHOB|nr:multidrug effflux MFS transporter [Palleronia abyssalis]SPJ25327.1 Bicyclomycin resistance protein [Palleronia abyssalis]
MSVAAESETPAGPALSRFEFVALVAFLMALNAAAIDVVIPALSTIGDAFDIGGSNERQFVITAYVLGFGGAQIIYGPLTDRYGRRPVLFAGLLIYIVGALAAIWSPTFGALLGARLVQGIGAASTRVVATALIRDRFEGAAMASAMSLVMMVFMIMPIVAPNIGALVLAFGDWHGLGLAMALVGIAALIWSVVRLPETLDPADRRPLTGKRVAEAFRIVVTNRQAACFTGAMAAFFGILFAFINQAEQIFTVTYGKGAGFTLYFSLVAVFMAGSSFANSRLAGRFGIRRLSQGALLAFMLLGGLHLVLAIAYGGATPFPLFLVMFILSMCCFGFVPPNLNALAMQPMGHVAGVASAVLGAAQTLVGGILGALVAYLYDGTLIPLLAGFLGLSALSLALIAVAERGRMFRPDV